MLQLRVISVSVDRAWAELYKEFWRPERFPSWASGLAQGNLHREAEQWVAEGPEGPVRIRFSPHNDYGVMDHWVSLGDRTTVYVPVRVIANGDGAEVTISLYRQPTMSDADFGRDAAWVLRDLEALKANAEGSAS